MVSSRRLDYETVNEIVALIEKSASSVFGRPLAVDAQSLTTTIEGQTLHFRDVIQSLAKLPPPLWPDLAADRITELHTGVQEARDFIDHSSWPAAKKCLRVRIQACSTTPGFDRPAGPRLSYSIVAETNGTVVRVTPALAARWNVNPRRLWAMGLFGNQHHLSVVKTGVSFGPCSAVALSGDLCTTGKLTCLDQTLLDLPEHPVVSFPSSDTLLCYRNFSDLDPRQKAQHQEHLDHWKLGTRYGLSSNFFVWQSPLEVRPLPLIRPISPTSPENSKPPQC